jgi:hypothetical protein
MDVRHEPVWFSAARLAADLTLSTASSSSLGERNWIGPSGAARHLGDIGGVHRFRTAGHSRPATAPPRSRRRLAISNATACPGQPAYQPGSRTSWPSSSSATTPPAGPTTSDAAVKGRPRWKRCAPQTTPFQGGLQDGDAGPAGGHEDAAGLADRPSACGGSPEPSMRHRGPGRLAVDRLDILRHGHEGVRGRLVAVQFGAELLVEAAPQHLPSQGITIKSVFQSWALASAIMGRSA